MLGISSIYYKKIFEDCFKNLLNEVQTALEAILSFLSVSSLFIGGHGFFKTYIAYILLGMCPNIFVCCIAFLVTFGIYSLDKIADMDKDTTNMPQRKSFLSRRRNLIFRLAIASYILAIILTLLNNPVTLPIIFIPFIANAFYATKIHRDLPRLKDIPFVKNLIVALAWAMVTTLLPALHMTNPANMTVALVIYFMLVKTLVDNILYDVRDIKGDKENGVRTMAAILGRRKTTALLLMINSTLLPLMFFARADIRPLMLLFTLYGYAYTLYFNKRRNPLALDFFVEGEWMLATIFLLFFGCQLSLL
jgi:4-hydroxybenzoate polyprenyltransferase